MDKINVALVTMQIVGSYEKNIRLYGYAYIHQ
jgi:hypothetical protein